MKLVLTSDLARIAGVPVTAIHFEKAGNSKQETGNRKPKR
jgi:hypothetical protein